MGKARNGLTGKQKAFADSYKETNNATESAVIAYGYTNRKTASVVGSENLGKPEIQKYFIGIAEKSAKNIEILSDKAKSENVRLMANESILDRAGYVINKGTQINVGIFSLTGLFDKGIEASAIEGSSENSQ